MAKLKLSPWHKAGTKPVRVGVYEVDNGNQAYAYWNGKKFCYRCWAYLHITKENAIESAYNNRNMQTTLYKLTTWRGILK